MFRIPVILDTNVFVGAGFNEGSASFQILEAIRSGELLLVWADSTRRETEHVVGKIPPLRDLDFASLFEDEGHYLGPLDEHGFERIPDPTDRKFAALAEATGVPVVSSDSDLLDHRNDLDVQIHTPTEYLERVGPFRT